MGHVLYMSLEIRKTSPSQVTCNSSGDGDVRLLYDDWVASILPNQYQDSVTLCATHAHMYHSLRGDSMCSAAGSTGPDGHPYCPIHISAAVTPRLLQLGLLLNPRITKRK